MMALTAGLLFGTGAFLTWNSFWTRPLRRDNLVSPRILRMYDVLAQAGLPAVSLRQVFISCVLVSLLAGAAVFLFFPVPALILVIMAAAGYAPWALIQSRARRYQKLLSEVWPEIIEHLSSGVRAGLALPEALAQLAQRGPEPLQPAFAEFAADYRVTGNFGACLDRLKTNLADPIADRVLEALRLARDVGGNDLTRLLRSLTRFLHDDLRTRGEIAARQSWTIAGSRLAVAAPWVILLVLSTREEAASAYGTPLGSTLILIGAGITVIAYRVMLHLGRLPTETRVLR